MKSGLATPVFPMEREEAVAILISDLHVPVGGGDVVDRLRGVLAAASALDASVHVLGDLFDSYVSPAQVRTGVWREVAAMFAAAASAGVSVDVLHGNRDFMLGQEFAAASRARVIAGGLRGRLAGADTLMLHGDELCWNDAPYQRAKRWLRHPATRWLASRLPLRLALKAAERARRRSRKVVAGGDQARFLPTVGAVRGAFAMGVDRLVFGHIHRHAHGVHEGGDYWVLPAFDATGIGLLARDGALSAVHFQDAAGHFAAVAAPPPCPFN
ncbi:MAG: hypothetical protein ABIP94_02320 [Planctomycetota bacterium]